MPPNRPATALEDLRQGIGAMDEAERAAGLQQRRALWRTRLASSPLGATCASRRRSSGDWLPRPSGSKGGFISTQVGACPSPSSFARLAARGRHPLRPGGRGRRKRRSPDSASASRPQATRPASRSTPDDRQARRRAPRGKRQLCRRPRRDRRAGPLASAGTSACSSAASSPARWPLRGCTSVTSPPRKASTVRSCLGGAAAAAVTRARAPSPASIRMRRALSCWSRATSMRRGRMPSEPSMMLMFWSTMACSMPASFRSASAKEMSTGSLLRRSSIMPQPSGSRAVRRSGVRANAPRLCHRVALSAAAAAPYCCRQTGSFAVGVVLSFEESPGRARVDLAAGRGHRRRAWRRSTASSSSGRAPTWR